MNKKILFTLSYFTPYISGLTIYVDRIATALANEGATVSVLTTQHQKELPVRDSVGRIDIIRVPYLLRLSKGFLMPLYMLFAWKEIQRHQVTFVSLPQFESSIIAILSLLARKPYFCIYHCEVILPGGIKNALVKYLLSLSHKVTLSFATKIITYTKDYGDHAKELLPYQEKMLYVYPPVPHIPEDKKYTEILRKKVILEKRSAVVVGIAARFASEKGIEYALDAIPLIEKTLKKRVNILFAGPEHPVGEEAYWEKMRPMVQKYKDKITFLGAIPPEKMSSFYQLIDVLLLPSVNATEAFGLVQVEAMYNGVPVVASNLPGIRVPTQVSGMGEVIPPGSVKDLADTVVLVLNHRSTYVKSVKTIEGIFGIEKTIRFYKTLIKNTV